MSTQDTSADVPAVAVSAAQRQDLGGLRREYVRRQQGRSKVESVAFTLYEFADGIVYQSAAQPERASGFAWRNAVRVYLAGQSLSGAGTQSISYRYILEVTGGGSLSLGGKFEVPVLAARQRRQPPDVERDLYAMLADSQRVVSQRLLPLARAALENGKMVLFDKVKVGNAGLHTEDGLIPWSSVTSVKVVNGSLVVKVEGRGRMRPALNLSMYQLPNSPLFLTLVNDLMTRR